MARCCGSTGTCSCKIEAGQNILLRGTGTSQDPFVVEADVALEVEDNDQFDIGLGGNGSREFPWLVEVRYAPSATLNGLPDVDNVEPEERDNGYVVGWNAARGLYELQPPTTAAVGTVLTDGSLAGDGSSGAALQVREDPARLLATGPNGLGLSDAGINRTLRRFPDAAARDAASPAPEYNSVSMLDTRPGQVDYWDGADWVPVESRVGIDAAGELLPLSGNYDGGRTIMYARRLSGITTAADGSFTALPTADLLTYAGVVSCTIQPTGAGTPWAAMAVPTIDRITAKAIRLDNGQPLAGAAITASVTALLY
jgi:hypothetical protein